MRSTLGCAWQPATAARSPHDQNFDFLPPHAPRMPQTEPFHEYAHQFHIGLLGAQAIVLVMNLLTELIQQPCGAQHRRGGGFHV